MLNFFKKYWSIFALAFLIFSFSYTKTYQVKSSKQPNVTFILTEPVWMYWIHQWISAAEPWEPTE